MDAIGPFEEIADFAVRHAAVLVEIDDGGLGIRADLAGGGTNRIGSLLRMSAADTPTATAAVSLVNAKSPANGPDGDLFLKLEIDLVGFGNVAAAMGATVGQCRFEGFVDLIVGRNGAMAMLSVGGAAGPGRGFRMFLGLALGERRRLSFVGSLGLLKLSLETGVATLQFGDAAIAFAATRADRGGHTATVDQAAPFSCASFTDSFEGNATQAP